MGKNPRGHRLSIFIMRAIKQSEAVNHIKNLLRERGCLTKSEAGKLVNAYGFLRRCEAVLRRYDNKSVSVFPSDPNEQRKLAICLGYEEFDVFRERYVDTRETIHALYERRVRGASG